MRRPPQKPRSSGLVVLGGGVVESVGPPYVRWVAEVARGQVLAETSREIPIVASTLGDDAGLLGAAFTALDGLRAAGAAGEHAQVR